MHHYVFAGYRVASDIALAGLSENGAAASDTPLRVRIAPASQALQSPRANGPNWSLAEDRLLLTIPAVARILLVDGNDLSVEVESRLAPEAAAPFVIEPGLGLLLQQRGEILLHAAAVAVRGQAILICGGSGAGKSTLAAALGTVDYPLLSDDLCLLRQDAAGVWRAIPDGRRSALWADAAEALALPLGPPLREGIPKYYVGADAAPDPQVLPIGAIYRLDETREAREWNIERLRGVEAIRTLTDHGYRPHLIGQMGHAPATLASVASLARQCGTFALQRSGGLACLQEGVRALEAHWADDAAGDLRR